MFRMRRGINTKFRDRAWLLQNCLAVLYTPEREHFGIVPVEAMYNQAPIIACNSGGPKVHRLQNYRNPSQIKRQDIYASHELIRGVKRC